MAKKIILTSEEVKKYGSLIKSEGISGNNLTLKIDGEIKEFLVYSKSNLEGSNDLLIKRIDNNDIETYNVTHDENNNPVKFEFQPVNETLKDLRILLSKLDEYEKPALEKIEQLQDEMQDYIGLANIAECFVDICLRNFLIRRFL